MLTVSASSSHRCDRVQNRSTRPTTITSATPTVMAGTHRGETSISGAAASDRMVSVIMRSNTLDSPRAPAAR